MDDHRLVKMALEQGLITQTQLDQAQVEQRKLADRGVEHDLWFLVQDLGYLSEDGARRLRKGLSSSTLKALEVEGYTIQGRIGSGGMGDVFRGVRPDGAQVAIKLLSSKFLSNTEYQERFTREAKAGMRLDHPHIVKSLATGEVAGCRYLMMELVEGVSLKARIADSGSLTVREALALIIQIGDALKYAWQHKVLHRDVKPANIMIAKATRPDEPFVAKLCDFGLAKVWQAPGEDESYGELTGAGLALGTPHYMSPEQASGDHDLDLRSDIYGLAASIYHALLGQTMYSGKSSAVIMYKQVTESLDLGPLARKGVDPALIALLEKMLQKDRRKRIADWDTVLADALRIGRGEDLAPRTATVRAARHDRRHQRTRLAIISASAAGVLFLCALAAWVLTSGHGGPRQANPASLALVLAESGLARSHDGQPITVILAPGIYEGPWRIGAGHAGLTLRADGPGVEIRADHAPALRCEPGATEVRIEGLRLNATGAPGIEILPGAKITLANVTLASEGGRAAMTCTGAVTMIACAVTGGMQLGMGAQFTSEDCLMEGAPALLGQGAKITLLRCRITGAVDLTSGSLKAEQVLITAPTTTACALKQVAPVDVLDVECHGNIGLSSEHCAVSTLHQATLIGTSLAATWSGPVTPEWSWKAIRLEGPGPGLPGQDGRGTGANSARLAAIPPLPSTSPLRSTVP